MSCGTPVIALNKGGTKETIVDKVTGIHFDEQTTKSIINAVEQFEKIDFDPHRIRHEATKYTHFEEQLHEFITEVY